jgi:hypothetical protein
MKHQFFRRTKTNRGGQATKESEGEEVGFVKNYNYWIFVSVMVSHVGISLGWNCFSAEWATANGIRLRKSNGYKTCPFDIIVTNYVGIVECLLDDFKYMCDDKFLEIRPSKSGNEEVIFNTKYNFIFNHESPGHANLYITENWPEGKSHFTVDNFRNLKERYNRRIDNFRQYVLNPLNRVTFIMTSWEKTDITDLHNAIRKTYPTLQNEVKMLNDPRGKQYYVDHMIEMNVASELNRLGHATKTDVQVSA